MKILVLGKGMAGSMIFNYLLSKKYDVVGLSRKEFDVLRDPIPDLSKYDYVINCIGLIKQKTYAENTLFFTINSLFPKQLVEKHKRVIHLSSDCVFSGNLDKKLSYKSQDISDAEDFYGMSKNQGEIPNQSMVLRTSIIGPSKDNTGLFEWFRNTTEDPIKGYTNHLWNGNTTLQLAKMIEQLIKTNTHASGLYQIASPKISKLELLQNINEVFGLNKNIIPTEDKQTINRSLHAFKQEPDIKTQLQELKEWMDNEAS